MEEAFKEFIDAISSGDYKLAATILACTVLFYVITTQIKKRLDSSNDSKNADSPEGTRDSLEHSVRSNTHRAPVTFHDFGDIPKPLTTIPVPGNALWANEDVLSKLAETLSKNTRVVLLWGPSGRGKTTQAAFFSERALRETHCFVIWLDCERGIEEALSSLCFEGLPPSLSWREGRDRLKAFLSSLDGTSNRALIILDSVDSQSTIEELPRSNALAALYNLSNNIDILAIAHSMSDSLTSVELPPLNYVKVKELVKNGLGVSLSDTDARVLTNSVAGNPLVCDLAVSMVATNMAESIYLIKERITSYLATIASRGEALNSTKDSRALLAIRVLLRIAVLQDGVERLLALGQRYLQSGIDREMFAEAVRGWASKDDIDLLLRAKWLVLLGGDEDEGTRPLAMHSLVAQACVDEGIAPGLDDESVFLDALYNGFIGGTSSRGSTVRLADVFRAARLDVPRNKQDEGMLQWLWIAANRETALRRKVWSYELEIDARTAMAQLLRNMNSENVVCRPASMSLCGSSGSKEQLPKRFAEAENELQMGYALRRTGKLSSSVRVLKGALRKTGWIDADGKIASCENEACVQKATDLATKILASYGYTRALEATQTDPRNVNWGAYRDAVTSVRRSMETAKSNTDGCALAYHYAAMVEYLLAWEALTGKGIEVLNVSGRTSKELLEDSIEHENSCATTLVGKTPRVKALTLGTVTTMDHEACLGRSQALLAELEGNTESADNRRSNALALLRSSVSLTKEERGRYSIDTAVRSLSLTHALLAAAASSIRAGNKAIAAASIDEAEESATDAVLAFRANADSVHEMEAERIRGLIKVRGEGEWGSILELENHYRKSLGLSAL